MGIDKNRVFDTKQISTLSSKTQTLMDSADTVIGELYQELSSLSGTLSKLPSDVCDKGLKDKVSSLMKTIKTDEFSTYKTKISKRMEELNKAISNGDATLAKKVDTAAGAVQGMTTRINALKDLIPKGTDGGRYEDFQKQFDECTKAWDDIDQVVLELLERIESSLKGGKNEEVQYSEDPVNLSTGNFIYEKTDVEVYGVPKLEFGRFYNTMDARDSVFGKGWRHPFEVCLIVEEKGAVVILEDSKEEHFEKKKSGSYLSAVSHSRLSEEDGYCYSTTEGEKYFFTKEGRYVSYIDNSGNTITLAYEDGKLIKVERNTDRAYLEFTYDEEGRIATVSSTNGERASYSYNEKGELEDVKNQSGESIHYEYDEEGRLLAITNAEGAVSVENEYDDKNRVTRQVFSDGGTMAFQYDEEAGSVELTERNGSKITYYHNDRLQNVRTVYEDGEERYCYNAKGKITLYRNPNGATTHYAYDRKGNLTQVIDALGVKCNATYDERNQLLKLSINGKTRLKNTYDTKGNLTARTDGLGRETLFAYDESNRVIKITRPDGSKVSLSYDQNGNIAEIVDPQKNSTKYFYDEKNRVIKTVDAKGAETVFSYDAANRLVSSINPLQQKTEYAYNKCGKITKIIQPDGAVLNAQYDSRNQLSCVTDAMGNRIEYSYDVMWNLIGVSIEGERKISYEYDSRNRLSKIIDALGNQVKQQYDPAGNVIAEIGPSGAETKYRYDAENHLTEKTDAEGNTTSYEYNEEGQVIKITDALGNSSTFAYDEAGQKISETDVMGNMTSYTYTALGAVAAITDGAGRKTNYAYKEGGLLDSISYPDGTKEIFAYDEIGNLTEKQDVRGNKIRYEYDAIGRIICMDAGNDRREWYSYDPMGRLTSIEDAMHHKTSYVYDKNGNLTSVTDALGNTTEYTYTAMNQVKDILQNGKLHTSYERDPMGRIQTVADAFGKKREYTYDGNGRRAEILDRGGVKTAFNYHKNGLLKEIQYADGRKAAFSYDPLGTLSQVEDWLGTTTFTNDTLGRVINVTGADGQAVSYSYGAAGERTSMTYPDGRTIQYQYDDALRLVELQDGSNSITYQYDQYSNLTKKLLPNGMQAEYGYSPYGEVTSLINRNNGKIIDQYRYEYDTVGNRTLEEKKREDLPKENGLFTYEYDAAGRLASVYKEKMLQKAFQYDAAGNRIQAEYHEGEQSSTIQYAYNQIGQLTAERNGQTNKTYEYDGRGNLVRILQDGSEQSTYDFGVLNRLERAANSQGVQMSYQYNGLGFRVGAVDETNQSQIQYAVDMTREYYNLLGSSSEGKHNSYVWDYGVAMSHGEQEFYYLNDELGSPMRLMGDNGAAYESYGYDEFGSDLYGNIGNMQPFGFTGYQKEVTGESYFAQARQYMPAVGRFMSEDLIKGNIYEPITINPYTYCYNRPNKYYDLNGKFAILATIAIGAAVGAVCSFVGSAGSEIIKNRGLDGVDWNSVAVDTVNGAINGGVAGTGVGIPALLATGAATGAAGYEAKQYLNGKTGDMSVSEHIAGCAYNGAMGALGNLGGAVRGPKGTIAGEAISPQGAAAFENAVNATIWRSGKEFNRMLMKEVISELEKFNLKRTGLITALSSGYGYAWGQSTQDWLQEQIDKILAEEEECS